VGEIIVRHLTKKFGDVVAVDDISIRIQEGEFVVLLGPSGCGKSTILRLIAGLEDASAGEIVIGERLVNFVDPVRRNVAMVFQNYALYPHMTVFRNIAFPLQMTRHAKAGIRPAVERAASVLELEHLLDRYPDQLSGGQRQRVALARAIVREPEAFLMDEPLSNLDALLRAQTRIELMRLHSNLLTTTVYVTHDQIEAMTMGHRIAVLRDGVLQQLGTPSEVYSRPANSFVATFIGSPPMNLVPGALERADGRWRFRPAGTDVEIDPGVVGADPGALERSADQVHLGVRPEDIELAPPGAAGLPGRIQLLEPVGSDLYLTVEAAGTLLRVRTAPDAPAAAGDSVAISFDPGKSHLFAADGRSVRAPANGGRVEAQGAAAR
jgi:multiple sugar transport system ATP-binding protein